MTISGGSSKSSSTPVDMTPDAFKNLQGPFASVLAGLLGFKSTPNDGGTTMGSGGTWGPGGSGGGTGSPAPGGPRMYTNANGMKFSVPGGADVRPDGGVWYGGANGAGSGIQQYLGKADALAPTNGTGGGGFTFTGNGGDPLSGIPKYNGPLTAGLGANEQTTLNALMNQQKTGGASNPANVALLDLIKTGGGMNPFLDAAIKAAQRPTLQGLEETLTRDLPGRFTQAGQFIQPQGSSAFDRAAAIATRGAADANADIATNMSYQNYNAGQDRKLDAAKSLPGVQATEIDNLIKNLQAQALPRLIQDQGIDRGLALFKDRVDNLLKTLGITAGVTQPTIAQDQKSKSSQFGFGLPNF